MYYILPTTVNENPFFKDSKWFAYIVDQNFDSLEEAYAFAEKTADKMTGNNAGLLDKYEIRCLETGEAFKYKRVYQSNTPKLVLNILLFSVMCYMSFSVLPQLFRFGFFECLIASFAGTFLVRHLMTHKTQQKPLTN